MIQLITVSLKNYPKNQNTKITIDRLILYISHSLVFLFFFFLKNVSC